MSQYRDQSPEFSSSPDGRASSPPVISINIRSNKRYLNSKVQQSTTLPLSRSAATSGAYKIHQQEEEDDENEYEDYESEFSEESMNSENMELYQEPLPITSPQGFSDRSSQVSEFSQVSGGNVNSSAISQHSKQSTHSHCSNKSKCSGHSQISQISNRSGNSIGTAESRNSSSSRLSNYSNQATTSSNHQSLRNKTSSSSLCGSVVSSSGSNSNSDEYSSLPPSPHFQTHPEEVCSNNNNSDSQLSCASPNTISSSSSSSMSLSLSTSSSSRAQPEMLPLPESPTSQRSVSTPSSPSSLLQLSPKSDSACSSPVSRTSGVSRLSRVSRKSQVSNISQRPESLNQTHESPRPSSISSGVLVNMTSSSDSVSELDLDTGTDSKTGTAETREVTCSASDCSECECNCDCDRSNISVSSPEAVLDSDEDLDIASGPKSDINTAQNASLDSPISPPKSCPSSLSSSSSSERQTARSPTTKKPPSPLPSHNKRKPTIKKSSPRNNNAPVTMQSKYSAYTFSKVEMWDGFKTVVLYHLQQAIESIGVPVPEIESLITARCGKFPDDKEYIPGMPTNGSTPFSLSDFENDGEGGYYRVYQVMHLLTTRTEAFLNINGIDAKFGRVTGPKQLGQPDSTLIFNNKPVMVGVYATNDDFAYMDDDTFFISCLYPHYFGKLQPSDHRLRLEEKRKRIAIDIVYRTFQYMVLNNLQYAFISTSTCTRFLSRANASSRTLYISPAVSHVEDNSVTISGAFIAICTQSILGYPSHRGSLFDPRAAGTLATGNSNIVTTQATLPSLPSSTLASPPSQNEAGPSPSSSDPLPVGPASSNVVISNGVLQLEKDTEKEINDLNTSFGKLRLSEKATGASKGPTQYFKIPEEEYPDVLFYPYDVYPVASPPVYNLSSREAAYSGDVKWWRMTKVSRTNHSIRFLNESWRNLNNGIHAEVAIIESDIPPESEQEFKMLEQNETRKRNGRANNYSQNFSESRYSRSSRYTSSNSSIRSGVTNTGLNRNISNATTFDGSKRSLYNFGIGAPINDPFYRSDLKKNPGNLPAKKPKRHMFATVKIVDTSSPDHQVALKRLENEARMCEYFTTHVKESNPGVPSNYTFGSVLGFLIILAVEDSGRPMNIQDLVTVKHFDSRYYMDQAPQLHINQEAVRLMHEALDCVHGFRVLHHDIKLSNFSVEEVEEMAPIVGYYNSYIRQQLSGSAPPPAFQRKKLKVRLTNFGESKLYVRLFKPAMEEEHKELDRMIKEAVDQYHKEEMEKFVEEKRRRAEEALNAVKIIRGESPRNSEAIVSEKDIEKKEADGSFN